MLAVRTTSVLGFTRLASGSFVIGREAFSSESELKKTLLHELYRLHHSELAMGRGVDKHTISADRGGFWLCRTLLHIDLSEPISVKSCQEHTSRSANWTAGLRRGSSAVNVRRSASAFISVSTCAFQAPTRPAKQTLLQRYPIEVPPVPASGRLATPTVPPKSGRRAAFPEIQRFLRSLFDLQRRSGVTELGRTVFSTNRLPPGSRHNQGRILSPRNGGKDGSCIRFCPTGLVAVITRTERRPFGRLSGLTTTRSEYENPCRSAAVVPQIVETTPHQRYCRIPDRLSATGRRRRRGHFRDLLVG